MQSNPDSNVASSSEKHKQNSRGCYYSKGGTNVSLLSEKALDKQESVNFRTCSVIEPRGLKNLIISMYKCVWPYTGLDV